MTARDEARKAARTRYVVFRGTLASGRHVRWATAAVAHQDGLLEPRLLSCGRSSNGLAETLGGLPERANVELVLADQDHGLAPLFVGNDDPANPAREFTGDGFLNLTGQLFDGYVDAAGVCHEDPYTPPLVCAGSVRRDDDGNIVVPMGSIEQSILGRPAKLVRIRGLLNAAFLAAGEHRDRNGSVLAAPRAEDWYEIAGNLQRVEDQSRVVPFYYGSVLPFAAVPTGDVTGAWWLAFAAYADPYLKDVASWQLSRVVDGEVAPFNPATRWEFYSFQVEVDYGDDAPAGPVWLVAVKLQTPAARELRDLRIEPPPENPLSWGNPTTPQTPTEIARRLLVDHSVAGAAAVDAASFDRARLALPVAGAVYVCVAGEGTLAELVGSILSAWPVGWWMGLDGKVHIAMLGQFSQAERDAIAAGLPEITPADILGGFEETVPNDQGQRGSPVVDVALEWTEEQRKTWAGFVFPTLVPSNAKVPLAERLEHTLAAGCLRPDRVYDAVAAFGSRMAWPVRRIRFQGTNVWATYERGQLFRLTYPFGAGSGDGTGYQRRLVRLERTDDDESSEYCIVTLEDCGALEVLRECLFDTVNNWVGVAGTGYLSVYAGSDQVLCLTAGLVGPGCVRMHLHTPGAADPANRRIARRIVQVVDQHYFRVDYPFAATETLPAAQAWTPVLDSAWHVMKSQETNEKNERYLTACDETTGEFRGGQPGFTVGAG